MNRDSLARALAAAIKSGVGSAVEKAEKALLAFDASEQAESASRLAGTDLGERGWEAHRDAAHLHQAAAVRHSAARAWGVRGAVKAETAHMKAAQKHLGYIPFNRR